MKHEAVNPELHRSEPLRTTATAATRLNLTQMEDLVRLAHIAHTLTPDLITDAVVDQVGALVRELAHHRLLEIGLHAPRTCPECSHRYDPGS